MRFGLGVAAFALVGAVVGAAVREDFAEVEFERCEARWSAETFSKAEGRLACELAALDRELAASIPTPDPGVFSSNRWSGELRAELDVELARVEPLCARLVALLESDAARKRLARGRGLTPLPPLLESRLWANLLAARAVRASDDADAARWLALALDLNELRCEPSLIGLTHRMAMDAIALSALRERASRPTTRAAPYAEALSSRLARRCVDVPWRAVGRFEAQLYLREAAVRCPEPGTTPLDWWHRASVLEAVCASVHAHEALVAGALPKPSAQLPEQLFDTFERTQREANERARLARVAVGVMAFRDERGALPVKLADVLAAPETAPETGMLELDRVDGRVELGLPGGRRSYLDHWTIPAN